MIKLNLSASWKSQGSGDNKLLYSSNTFKLKEGLLSLFEKKLSCIEAKGIDLSFISIKNQEVIAITDRYGTSPIYYSFLDNQLFVSDQLNWVVEQSQAEVSKDIAYEYLMFDMVISQNKTLYEGVFRVPSGVRFDIRKQEVLESIPVYSPEALRSWNDYYDQLPVVKESFLNSFPTEKKYYVPLSGGIDSRLVLAGALESSPVEIYSRTYGSTNSMDVKYGTRVAKKAGIQHEIINKTNTAVIDEFEQMVFNTAGSVSGVHGHDVAGRDILESKYDLKVTGFIGDYLARGVQMIDAISTNTNGVNFLNRSRSITGSLDNYQLFDNSKQYSEVLEKQRVTLHSFIEEHVTDLRFLSWTYYEKRHIPNLTSVLEYPTHFSKPNFKPFLNPIVRNFICSAAGLNEWPGETYFKFAQEINRELFDVPLSSNSIFNSNFGYFRFRLSRRINKELRTRFVRLTNGRWDLGSYNHTLNWSRILREERNWVIRHLKLSSEFLDFNYDKIQLVYDRHCRGIELNETLILRLISLGVVLRQRYD